MSKTLLSGRHVLVTRPEGQADEIMQALSERGAKVSHIPVVEFTASPVEGQLEAALRSLESFDYVVLTSVNGLRFFLDAAEALGISSETLETPQYAAIGPVTAAAVEKAIKAPSVVPKEYISEAIADVIPELEGKRVLLARADKARKTLPKILKERGAVVEEVTLYEIMASQSDEKAELLRRSNQDAAFDLVILTSAMIAKSTSELFERANLNSERTRVPCACIGPITSDSAEKLGLNAEIVAQDYTAKGIIEAVDRYFRA